MVEHWIVTSPPAEIVPEESPAKVPESQVTVRPESPLIAAFKVTLLPVELRFNELEALGEATAFETVMDPAVWSVAFAELIWLCKEVGVTREVPSVAVYQVPPIQAPVASTTPAVSTVIDCGKPRVLAEVLPLSVESW
jgi:hypothetical protein